MSVPVRLCLAVALSLLAAGCKPEAHGPGAPACDCPGAPVALQVPLVKPSRAEPEAVSARSVQPHQPLAVCESDGKAPLDAARTWADQGEWEKALSCSAQASALAPNDVAAHLERAAALTQLERYDEARLAFARVLALEPDSLEGLLGAAHLYAETLPSSRENDELGSLYAERGLDLARAQNDEPMALEFGRESAIAFNDIGQSADALDRAEWVLARKKGDPRADYERAVALFELCRFAEAKKAFQGILTDKDRAAHAHHHLGLLLEREGRQKEADAHFAKAEALAPDNFPPPVLLSPADFKAQLQQIIDGLPDDLRHDLTGVPVQVEDLPRDDDLIGDDPPLSPTIVGLYRGPPLTESCEGSGEVKPGEPCRSVVLYRKNLARAVHSRDELLEQVRVTLLHEIGHLRGEDDYELAARGLE